MRMKYECWGIVGVSSKLQFASSFETFFKWWYALLLLCLPCVKVFCKWSKLHSRFKDFVYWSRHLQILPKKLNIVQYYLENPDTFFGGEK